MCFFCISGAPLSSDDMNGKYGDAMSPFIDNSSKYQITMCQAPCKEPCCWLGSMICCCPAQIHMRHKVLNHVNPGSGWSNYKCCQGYFGGCCCLQPGNMGEQTCPVPCMCLETILCPGAAVSATSNVIREQYQLGLDEDDARLIRCSNCLQYLAFCLSCLNICIDFEGDDAIVCAVNTAADVMFCCVCACMTAQTYHEIKYRDNMAAPQRQNMSDRH